MTCDRQDFVSSGFAGIVARDILGPALQTGQRPTLSICMSDNGFTVSSTDRLAGRLCTLSVTQRIHVFFGSLPISSLILPTPEVSASYITAHHSPRAVVYIGWLREGPPPRLKPVHLSQATRGPEDPRVKVRYEENVLLYM